MDQPVDSQPCFSDAFLSYFDEITVQELLPKIRHFSPVWKSCAGLLIAVGDVLTLNMADVHAAMSQGDRHVIVYPATDIEVGVWKKYRLLRADFTEREDGVNALMWAAHIGDVDYVMTLCRRGAAYVDRQLQNGNSVLMEAIAGNSRQRAGCVRALLEAGARSNLENKAGHNALTVAASEGHLDLVRLLLTRCHFDVNHKTKVGSTALSLAAAGGHLEVVHLLASEYTADILAQDKDRMTSLCWAQLLQPRIAGYLSLQLAVRGQLQSFIQERARLVRQQPDDVALFRLFHQLVLLLLMLKPAREQLVRDGVLEMILTHPAWHKPGETDSDVDEEERIYLCLLTWFTALCGGMLYNEQGPANHFLASRFAPYYIGSIDGMLPSDNEDEKLVSLAMLLPIVYTEKGRHWLQEEAPKYENVFTLLTGRSEMGDVQERDGLRQTFTEVMDSMYVGYELRAAMRMIGEAEVKSACPEPEVRVRDKLVELIVYFSDIRHTLREKLADLRMQQLIEEELQEREQESKAQRRRRNKRARAHENKMKEDLVRARDASKPPTASKAKSRPQAKKQAASKPAQSTLNVEQTVKEATKNTTGNGGASPAEPDKKGEQNATKSTSAPIDDAKSVAKVTVPVGNQWKQLPRPEVAARPVDDLLEEDFPVLSRTSLAKRNLQSIRRDCEEKPAFSWLQPTSQAPAPSSGPPQGPARPRRQLETPQEIPRIKKQRGTERRASVGETVEHRSTVEKEFEAAWMEPDATRGTSASSSEVSVMEPASASPASSCSSIWEMMRSSSSLSDSSAESGIDHSPSIPGDDDDGTDEASDLVTCETAPGFETTARDLGIFMPSLHDKHLVMHDLPKLPANALSVTSLEQQYAADQTTKHSPKRKETVTELLKLVRQDVSTSRGADASSEQRRSPIPPFESIGENYANVADKSVCEVEKKPQRQEKLANSKSSVYRQTEVDQSSRLSASKSASEVPASGAGGVDCKGQGDSKHVGVPRFDVGLWQAMVESTANSSAKKSGAPPPGFLPMFPNPKVYKRPTAAVSWTSRSLKWRPLLSKLVALPRSMLQSIGSLRLCPFQQFTISKGRKEKKVFLGLLADGTEVAIKRLPKTEATCLVNEKRVLRLPKMAASEYIINYVDYVEDEKYAYLALELCDYALPEYLEGLKEAGRLARDAPVLVGQLLQAVMAMHDAAVLHTTLKPCKVLIDSTGRPRLSSFEQSLSRGLNDVVCRTYRHGLDWMSKTMVDHNGGKRFTYTPECDMQVVGMLVHYIVSGGNHLYGPSDRERVANIQNDYPVCFGDIQDVLLANMLLFMIHPDVTQRKKAAELRSHPYLWTDQKKMNFLNTILILPEMVPWASNPTKNMIQQCDQWIEQTNWRREIDDDLMVALMRKTDYSPAVSDLLRCMADTQREYQQLPLTVQEMIGEPAVYFMSKFSRIFMAIYEIVRESKWRGKKCLQSYFGAI